jgi:hypothetical protein
MVQVSLGACGRSSLEPGAEGTAGDVPRPIAPLSTSRVTSRRPTLHWGLPIGVNDATLDLCLDRACTKPIGAPALVRGTSYVPATDLPTGVVYWRLHASTTADITSPTWEFTVGASTAPVDTSWGTTLDVNGDGYADLVVGVEYSAYVYLGSRSGLATASTALNNPWTCGELDCVEPPFGQSVASAGDVNGDGYADLVVGAEYSAYVYLGGPTGISTTSATTLTAPYGDDEAGQFQPVTYTDVASAGDVNGDGYADVLVGVTEYGSFGGAYVYLGGPAGLSTAPATKLKLLVDAAIPGSIAASAGDVNGDGYADVVVSDTQGVYVYLGGSGGLASEPATILTAPNGATGFGQSIACAGDVNGDGYADLVIGASGAQNEGGHVYLYLGNATGLASVPATALTAPGDVANLVLSVAGDGDVDGDGYADVAVVGGAWDGGEGHAYIYLGSATGLADGPAATLTGSDNEVSVVSGGDENGDGYDDVVVVGVGSDSWRVNVYPGSGSGIVNTPVTTLAEPTFYGDFSVFGAAD